MIMFLMGVLVGWLFALSAIASECEKLGKFYVGNRVYTVSKIEDTEE
jgi:hypothetical protein